jgi:hypothetical protein
MVLILSRRRKNKFVPSKSIWLQLKLDKSYADRRRKPIEFEVGDFVYLKVSPMKSVQCFGVKRKLAPRYVGPF